MKTKFLISFTLLFLFFFSCNKEKQRKKMIIGTWIIQQYEFTNSNTLVYKYPSNGKIIFEKCASNQCPFNLELNYQNNGIDYLKKINGTYAFENEEYIIIQRENNDGTTSVLKDCRILFINKEHLIFILKDETGLHRLTCSKE